jgi:hypothetical protein
MVSLELDWYVRCIDPIEEYNADVIDYAAVIVNPLENVAGFTCRSEASSRRLTTVETLKPCLIADDENVVRFGRTGATPLRPTLIRTAWVIVEEKLI